MKKPTQAAPKDIKYEKLSDEDKKAFDNAVQDCYKEDFFNLRFHLFINHYHGKNYGDNLDTFKLLKYDDVFLRGFKQYILDIENRQKDPSKDEDYAFLSVKNDQKPTYYRADIVNKIDMIMYLRTKVSESRIDKLAKYIRPYHLQDVFNILTAYIEATYNIETEEWVNRDKIIKFLKDFNNDILFLLTVYVEMIHDSVLRKNGDSYANDDWVRNHYSIEDQRMYHYTKSALNLIEEAKNSKSRIRRSIFNIMKEF